MLDYTIQPTSPNVNFSAVSSTVFVPGSLTTLSALLPTYVNWKYFVKVSAVNIMGSGPSVQTSFEVAGMLVGWLVGFCVVYIYFLIVYFLLFVVCLCVWVSAVKIMGFGPSVLTSFQVAGELCWLVG